MRFDSCSQHDSVCSTSMCQRESPSRPMLFLQAGSSRKRLTAPVFPGPTAVTAWAKTPGTAGNLWQEQTRVAGDATRRPHNKCPWLTTPRPESEPNWLAYAARGSLLEQETTQPGRSPIRKIHRKLTLLDWIASKEPKLRFDKQQKESCANTAGQHLPKG